MIEMWCLKDESGELWTGYMGDDQEALLADSAADLSDREDWDGFSVVRVRIEEIQPDETTK